MHRNQSENLIIKRIESEYPYPNIPHFPGSIHK